MRGREAEDSMAARVMEACTASVRQASAALSGPDPGIKRTSASDTGLPD